jgi:hypothetical protein
MKRDPSCGDPQRSCWRSLARDILLRAENGDQLSYVAAVAGDDEKLLQPGFFPYDNTEIGDWWAIL